MAGPVMAEKLGLGRAALPDEITAWDVDVRPDGLGLPDGSGSALAGEEIFAEKCGACHGDFAEGVDNWPKLAGGKGTLARKDPLKTVGSYWPHLSTAWDYVNRSMPFGNAQSLTHDEVYAIVAYILFSNDLVADDFVLSKENFTEVVLPNADGFVMDDRDATEYANWSGEPCMENCKDEVKITMRALVLDVTPEETAAKVADEEAAAASEATPVVAEAEPAKEEPAAAALDAELVAAGEKVFKKCKACHQVGEGAKNKTGPALNGVVGQVIGVSDGFKYSKGMSELGASGAVWDEAALAAFLTKPKKFVKGTKMSFSGLKKAKDLQAVTEYLKSFSQ